MLPRFKTAADKRSPEPHAADLARFDEGYSNAKKATGDFLRISEHFRSVPNTSADEVVDEGKITAANAADTSKPAVMAKRKTAKQSSSERDTANADAAEAELLGTGVSVNDFNSYLRVRASPKHRSPFPDVNARKKRIERFRQYHSDGHDTADMMAQILSSNWLAPVDAKWKMRPKEMQWRQRHKKPGLSSTEVRNEVHTRADRTLLSLSP